MSGEVVEAEQKELLMGKNFHPENKSQSIQNLQEKVRNLLIKFHSYIIGPQDEDDPQYYSIQKQIRGYCVDEGAFNYLSVEKILVDNGCSTDLSRMDLSELDLSGMSFNKIRLNDTNLQKCRFCTNDMWASFTGAEMAGANINGSSGINKCRLPKEFTLDTKSGIFKDSTEKVPINLDDTVVLHR